MTLPPRLLHATALGRRAVWRLEDVIRRRINGDEDRLPRRPPPQGRVSFSATETLPSGTRTLTGRGPHPPSDRVGVLRSGSEHGRPPAAVIGEVLGLHVIEAAPAAWAGVVERASSEQWPLIVLHLGPQGQSSGGLAGLRHFVERGGQVLVVVEPEGAVEVLGRAFGHDLPALRRSRTPVGGLRFSSREPRITSWFTGVAVTGAAIPWSLDPASGARPLAWTGEEDADPVLTVTPIGGGAVFTSVPPARLTGALRDQLAPSNWPAIVPPLLLMRRLYGELAWHAPLTFANLTIDDPALTGGRLGFDYERLADLAEEAGYHVTVATIPRELGIAEPSVLQLLARRRHRVSACYHGWSHRGYEFFLPDARRGRFRGRPLEEQERAIARAAAAGRQLWRRTGVALDRVMVFPHGVAPAATLDALSRHGFLASSNFDERDPLGAQPPIEPDLGLRPADTAWAEVPLLWRRGLDDPRFLIDIGFGRPLLSFGHRGQIGSRLERFAGYAARVQAAAPGVRWGDLEGVAKHAYLVRRDPAAGWQVLMTADAICLHNDGRSPRRYAVTRPHLPGHAHLSEWSLEVGPGQSREVLVNRTLASALPSPHTTGRPGGPGHVRMTCSSSSGEPIPTLELEEST